MSNTYKASKRDGVKYVTCNGFDIGTAPLLNWGWYGGGCVFTAMTILEREFGPKTAAHYCCGLARVLATYPEEGFILTSGMIDFILRQLDTPCLT